MTLEIMGIFAYFGIYAKSKNARKSLIYRHFVDFKNF